MYRIRTVERWGPWGGTVVGAILIAQVSTLFGPSPILADAPAGPAQPPSAAPQSSPTPEGPEETVIEVDIQQKRIEIPQAKASQTQVSETQIAHTAPDATLTDIISSSVPGASSNPDEGLRIRGADDQFSTYLDGAPIPQSVAGSVTDVLDPREIRSLRVYTGGFPAEYGGQLSGVFDITTKSGLPGGPRGSVFQSAASFNTFVTEGNIGGTAGNLGYFVSGSHRQSNLFLTPLTEDPLNDAGYEDHGFSKISYRAGGNDNLILQLGANNSRSQIPNTPDRQAVGQDDVQHESGGLANLIWTHREGIASSRLIFYSHQSLREYTGSPADLLASAGGSTDGLVATYEDLSATYVGLRGDQTYPYGPNHLLKAGLDISNVSGSQDFTVTSPASTGFAPLVNNTDISGSDLGFYVQDDWTPGRFSVNYGLRYDVDHQDTISSQLSPRLNVRYKLNTNDTLHAFYDRLFQPVSPEDAKTLVGQSSIGDNSVFSPLLPERDNLYEVGIDHNVRGLHLGLAAYYKTAVNTRDDDSLGNTQITVPVNDASSYTKGVELAASRQFTPALSGFLNYAYSLNQAEGPVTGGLVSPGDIPPGYFTDDHDQTHTISSGLSFDRGSVFANLTGEYGSGQPYGEVDDANGNAIAINNVRVPPHLVFNLDAGKRLPHGIGVSVFIKNILNYPYIIKQADVFSNVQWAMGRSVGIKVSEDF